MSIKISSLCRLLSLSAFAAIALPAQAEICSDLKAELAGTLERIPAPGAILTAVLADGKTCLVSTGFFDVQKKTPMALDSQMKVWSVTKTFTAAAALQLVSEGKLHLDDKISKWFPDYPKSDRIEIWHLLSHTSGVIDYMTLPGFEFKWQRPFTPEELIQIARASQPDIEPGTETHYSNTGMVMMGRIIEAVTGDKIENQFRKRFFDPLGLKRTYLATTTWGNVHGYNRVSKSPLSFREMTNAVSPQTMWSAGALVSTAEDLRTWFSAILAGKVLSKEMTAKLTTAVRLKNGQAGDFGLGMHSNPGRNGGLNMGHGGGPLEGHTASMLYESGLKTIRIVLANGSNTWDIPENEPDSGEVLGGIGWDLISHYK